MFFSQLKSRSQLLKLFRQKLINIIYNTIPTYYCSASIKCYLTIEILW